MAFRRQMLDETAGQPDVRAEHPLVANDVRMRLPGQRFVELFGPWRTGCALVNWRRGRSISA